MVVAADGQLHQEVAEGLVPARLLPELDRLQGRHQQLDAPRRRPSPRGRSGRPCCSTRNPSGRYVYAPAPSWRIIPARSRRTWLGRHGVGRGFLQRRDQGIRPAHGSLLACTDSQGDERNGPTEASRVSGQAAHLCRSTRRGEASSPDPSGTEDGYSHDNPPPSRRAPADGFRPVSVAVVFTYCQARDMGSHLAISRTCPEPGPDNEPWWRAGVGRLVGRVESAGVSGRMGDGCDTC